MGNGESHFNVSLVVKDKDTKTVSIMRVYLWWSLCTLCLYSHARWELQQATQVFLMCSCDVFRVLINSLVCWFFFYWFYIFYFHNLKKRKVKEESNRSLCLTPSRLAKQGHVVQWVGWSSYCGLSTESGCRSLEWSAVRGRADGRWSWLVKWAEWDWWL